MKKIASTEQRDRWAVRGAAIGGALGLLKAHKMNKAYRKRSIFTRNLSDIFKKRKALKAVGYGRMGIGGLVAGGAAGALAIAAKDQLTGGY